MPENDPDLVTIFAEALERTDPAARTAYLNGACGDNAKLRQRVEALLAAHDRAGRFLEGESPCMSDLTAPETLQRFTLALHTDRHVGTTRGYPGMSLSAARRPRHHRAGSLSLPRLDGDSA